MEGWKAQFVLGTMSGEAKGLAGMALRGVLRAMEPGYAGVMRVRNGLYGWGVLRSRQLGVPVISVGNITTGGTGKTPVVRWLAERMRSRGMHPAVLMRGYKRDRAAISDEQALLEGYLNGGQEPAVVVHAEADRVAGGERVLRAHPEVEIFILDDGFQHRRLKRDFDLVLIDATLPFGYGHVLPRGLLREPLAGLRRADAFLLTRSDQIAVEQRMELEATLRMWNPLAPVYRARHAHTGLRTANGEAVEMEELGRRRFFAFAGIAQPAGLNQQLTRFGEAYRGHWWFEDHHDYDDDDLLAMRRRAEEAGAEVLVVTEKDWAKIQRLAGARDEGIPIWRIEVRIAMEEKAEAGLLELIETRIDARRG